MNTLILLLVVCSSFAVGTTSAQFWNKEECPNPSTVRNFNLQRYSGKWYEIQRGPWLATLYEAGLRCVQAEYTPLNSTHIRVLNGGLVLFTNYFYSQNGTARVLNATDASKLQVGFDSIWNRGEEENKNNARGNYWVLDTDYTSYSIVYSCANNGLLGGKSEVAWILARTRTLDTSLVDRLVAKIAAVSPTLAAQLKPTNQTKC